MDKNLKSLIGAYARHTVAALNDQQTGGQLLADAMKMDWLKEKPYMQPWFTVNKPVIEEFKREIEATIETAGSAKAQVSKSLTMVWKERTIREFEAVQARHRLDILDELLLMRFSGEWSASQVAHFKKISEVFRTNNSYFISYTNRSAGEVNKKYKPVYKVLLPQEKLNEMTLGKQNLLAKALFHRMNTRNMKNGFYDFHSITPGEKISPKVVENVTKSFAFIQLISADCFTDSTTNWCYDEFTTYYQTHCSDQVDPQLKDCYKNLFLFFIIDDDAYPHQDQTPFTYSEWIKLTKSETLHWKVYEKPDYDSFFTYVDQLIAAINTHRSRLVEAVPD